ncbi:MAG: RidA family protein [Lysobacteraceae bacterium]
MSRQIIHSDAAPAAIGPYSQAVRVGNTVWLSGQIPLDPATMEMVSDDVEAQARQVFKNLTAVAEAAGGTLANAVRIGIFMTDLSQFAKVNAVMAEFFNAPFPARATVEVSALPRGAKVEVEAILVLG